MKRAQKPLSLAEFTMMIAMMISIVAMATDIMLPALGVIGDELRVADPNDAQLIISSLFVGFAVGQLFAGPLSDSIGRKPTIYAGYVVFVIGCVLSVMAGNLETMLAGRVLQGLGAAPARVITVAIVRDSYEGRPMARVMSIVMAVFILVPAIAPSIGQGLILAFPWQSTFIFLALNAVLCFVWFGLRQAETLLPEHRRPFSVTAILSGIRVFFGYRAAVGYTVSAGIVFGAFIGYLSSAQQIFQTTYDLGEMFPIYFGIAALAIGAASVTNSKLVMRLGMRYLSHRGLIGVTFLGAALLIPAAVQWQGVPPLWMFMAWLLPTFFCVGILFGNFNALAMEPLGQMAGLGAALVGALQSFISIPLGWAVGNFYDGTVLPLVGGFALLGAMSLLMMTWTERKAATRPA
ncbi:MAG: multidrug effflux MFS transporter [Rhodospirillales bacterium]|nr:multidrug effflux MFS transporter [Rhodospirillales bacterium]MBO6787439.1 multidrug effflux MFS transporter [Rhodospirillales bacterium]